MDFLATFLFGLISSLHCVGMCGGFVLTYASAKSDSSKFFSHFLYNFSRIASYTLLGFLFGGLGSFISISNHTRGIIQISASILMILIALNILGLISFLKFLLPRPVKFFTHLEEKIANNKNSFIPVILGFINGFMPCTPLVAMQIKALASGSAVYGGLTLLFFGLGTVPLMFGFGYLAKVLTNKWRHTMFRVSGFIILIFAFLMLDRGLLLIGSPFSFGNLSKDSLISSIQNQDIQEIELLVSGHRYNPEILVVKKDIPVRLTIKRPDVNNFCNQEIVFPSFGIDEILPDNGTKIIEFTPRKEGEFFFSCGMGMISGKIIIQS